MRRAGVTTLIAMILAVSVAPLANASEDAASDAGAKQAAAHPDQQDYYTRRAESVIAAEKSVSGGQHPLAAAYPGFDVVVCEAGCPNGAEPRIVFARTTADKASTESEMIPTSARADDHQGADAMSCLAGCYDRTTDAEVASPSKAAVAPWSTSVSAAPANPPEAAVRDKLSPVR